MTNGDTIGFVILSWNDVDRTIACTTSLLGANTRRPLSIVVVDNKSTQLVRNRLRSELAELARHHSDNTVSIQLVEPSANLGYARGMNQGAAKLSTNWIFFCNNDLVFESWAVDYLVEELQSNAIIYGRTSGDALENAFPSVARLLGSALGLHRLDNDQFGLSGVSAGDWMQGVIIGMHRSVWEREGIPQQTFMYSEDLRLGVQAHRWGLASILTERKVADHVDDFSANMLWTPLQKEGLKAFEYAMAFEDVLDSRIGLRAALLAHVLYRLRILAFRPSAAAAGGVLGAFRAVVHRHPERNSVGLPAWFGSQC